MANVLNGMQKLNYARMTRPVNLDNLLDAAYFTVKGGHRMKYHASRGRYGEIREVINNVDGQLTTPITTYIGAVFFEDRKGFKIRSYRYGMEWMTEIKYEDITCYA